MTRKLLVMDVDSTFIQNEQLDLLADEVGARDYVADVTEQMRRGEIDFPQSLRLRTKPLAGLDVAVLDQVRARMELTPGARELVDYARERDWPVYLVSGGFHDLLDIFVEGLGITGVRANRLDTKNGTLTGEVLGDIIGRQGKADHLHIIAEAEGIDVKDTIAVGDGANDIAMVEAAGLGVAFGGSEILEQAADVCLPGPRIDALIPHLDKLT